MKDFFSRPQKILLDKLTFEWQDLSVIDPLVRANTIISLRDRGFIEIRPNPDKGFWTKYAEYFARKVRL